MFHRRHSPMQTLVAALIATGGNVQLRAGTLELSESRPNVDASPRAKIARPPEGQGAAARRRRQMERQQMKAARG